MHSQLTLGRNGSRTRGTARYRVAAIGALLMLARASALGVAAGSALEHGGDELAHPLGRGQGPGAAARPPMGDFPTGELRGKHQLIHSRLATEEWLDEMYGGAARAGTQRLTSSVATGNGVYDSP